MTDYANAVVVPLRDINGIVIAFTLIDRSDLALVSRHTWRLLNQLQRKYAVRSVWNKGNFRTFRLHRVLLGLGLDDGYDVDHGNGCGLDNRRSNLRRVTHSRNMLNRNNKASGKTSQHVGVHFDKSRNKWAANIMVDYQHRYLGRFSTEIEAAEAVNNARRKLLEGVD